MQHARMTHYNQGFNHREMDFLPDDWYNESHQKTTKLANHQVGVEYAFVAKLKKKQVSQCLEWNDIFDSLSNVITVRIGNDSCIWRLTMLRTRKEEGYRPLKPRCVIRPE